MFYYLIITLGAGGCRKLLSLVGRRGVMKKLGRRERERDVETHTHTHRGRIINRC